MKINYKSKIIQTLKDLAKQYPAQTLSQHIGLATFDYPTIDALSDKELFFALEKYMCEKQLDMVQGTLDKPRNFSIEKIVEEGMDLDNILNEEEDF